MDYHGRRTHWQKPIQTSRYPSNWELSSARAYSFKTLLDLGFPPNRLASAGYGEFFPISDGETETDLQQNRRIELKPTSVMCLKFNINWS